jgi:hypothetical protein
MMDVEAAGVGEPSEIDHHAIGDQPAQSPAHAGSRNFPLRRRTRGERRLIHPATDLGPAAVAMARALTIFACRVLHRAFVLLGCMAADYTPSRRA